MKWLKKIFGKKEKPKDKSHIPEDFTLEERKISPLLTEEQPISVPSEKVIDKIEIEEKFPNNKEYFTVMEIVQPEELIAPTLERQDEIVDDGKINWNEPIEHKTIEMESNRIFIAKDEEGKKKWKEVRDYSMGKKDKNKKPKKQAKKKDNFNDDASKPKGRNFLM